VPKTASPHCSLKGWETCTYTCNKTLKLITDTTFKKSIIKHNSRIANTPTDNKSIKISWKWPTLLIKVKSHIQKNPGLIITNMKQKVVMCMQLTEKNFSLLSLSGFWFSYRQQFHISHRWKLVLIFCCTPTQHETTKLTTMRDMMRNNSEGALLCVLHCPTSKLDYCNSAESESGQPHHDCLQ